MLSSVRCLSRPNQLVRAIPRIALNRKFTLDTLSSLSGMPDEIAEMKRVRIFQPAKNAMQSGAKGSYIWKMEWELSNAELGGRWQNPTMGWTSTGDPLSNLNMKFTSKDAAIEFAKKMGWSFVVKELPPTPEPSFREYVPGGGPQGGTRWRGTYDVEEDPDATK
eukprot:c2477_g1_i1.p1 GENE.c2477_g1_i1~~c2477_g1_i1.p1  ORF type:complete len:164 (+),score=23.99 c2477_g1_i1:61-552(+)